MAKTEPRQSMAGSWRTAPASESATEVGDDPDMRAWVGRGTKMAGSGLGVPVH